MFFTGAFKLETGSLTTCQRCHDKEEYDDEILDSGLLEDPHGYVTNTGNVITIHIKKTYNNTAEINSIRCAFGLTDNRMAVEIKEL